MVRDIRLYLSFIIFYSILFTLFHILYSLTRSYIEDILLLDVYSGINYHMMTSPIGVLFVKAVVLCFLSITYVIAGTLPCKTIPESTDREFMSYTLVDLYRDPKTYYASDLPRKCNMKYIDLLTIVPADPKKETLWISYLGDSLARDLFHAAAQRFGGYHPFLKAEETTFDAVMANHLGPEGF